MLLALLITLSLCSCSIDKNESDALDVIKTYVKAIEENDTEKQQECMDPNVNAFSEGFVNSLGDLFGISDAYDMANGAMGLLVSASEQALGVDIKYNFKEVISNNISENNGDITVKYELSVTNNETKEKAKQDVSWTFYMVQKDSQWYIQGYDRPQSIVSAEEYDSINAIGTTIQNIKKGSDFSDGVAWVESEKYVNGNYESRYYCIDKSGTILFELEPDYKPYSYSGSATDDWFYSNGVSLIIYKEHTEEEYWKIVDKTGNEVMTLVDEETVLCPQMLENGYIVVFGDYESIYGNERKYGLISPAGEWVIQPSSEVSSITHSGSDVFLIKDYGYGNNYFLNAKTGTKIDQYIELDGMSKNISEIKFNDGYAVFLENVIVDGDLKYYLFRISSEGKVEKLFMPYDGSYDLECGDLSDGLVYIDDDVYNSPNRGFFDMNGNVVVDLSPYDVHSSALRNSKFTDGYCALNINGFCLFVDSNGRNIFEPIKIEDDNIIFNDGVLRIVESDGVCYYDTNGNRLYGPVENTSLAPELYSCGLGKISGNDGVHYVDVKGNIVF